MTNNGIKQIQHPNMEQGHFNGGEHRFVAIAPREWQTISCLLPNGRHVTFAFVPGPKGSQEMECVDIHHTIGEKFPVANRGQSQFWQQHLVGFSADGGDAFDTRKLPHDRRVTLTTLLLSSEHYKPETPEHRAEREADAKAQAAAKHMLDTLRSIEQNLIAAAGQTRPHCKLADIAASARAAIAKATK